MFLKTPWPDRTKNTTMATVPSSECDNERRIRQAVTRSECEQKLMFETTTFPWMKRKSVGPGLRGGTQRQACMNVLATRARCGIAIMLF